MFTWFELKDVPETDVAQTDVAETDVPETDIAETDVAETDVAETDVPETDRSDGCPRDGWLRRMSPRRMAPRRMKRTDVPQTLSQGGWALRLMAYCLRDIRLCHSSWSSLSRRWMSPRRLAARRYVFFASSVYGLSDWDLNGSEGPTVYEWSV